MRKHLSSPLFIAISILIITLFGISGFYYEVGFPAWLTMLLAIVLGLVLVVVLKLLLSWSAPWFKKIPVALFTSIVSGFLALFVMRMFAFRWPSILFYTLAVFGLVCITLLVFGVQSFLLKDKKGRGILLIITSLVLGIIGFFGFTALDGDPFTDDFEEDSNLNVVTLSQMNIQDPSKTGNYDVETFTYGSGTDKNRAEYAEGVKIKTPTVDASLLLPEWKGKKKKWREKFWGFGVKNFPLNGRVYLPKGDGPFPLVMMVHGNHSMIDYSDAGYAYLGNLLASRGIIAVSVDENFINAHWSGDFRGKEMPARGWLLLKHLQQWKKWNSGGQDELEGKVDMDNIALIGHSRGGEAVSIAAAFNTLNRFPDNANETFDFGFGIKGIVTIAPTDYRYDRQITLKDINYLSLQGAYDSDETSFWGMRPYHRLTFSEDFKGFKAGLYINHANHGQFNSTWGRADFGPPMAWLLNLKPLMAGEDQRQVAKVYISAFVEAVLKQNQEYRPMLQNVDLVEDWLPKETYQSQYADNRKEILLDFEEDIDVGSAPAGIQLHGKNLKVWREMELTARDGGSQENNALVLGWSFAQKNKSDSLPSYSIKFPDSLKNFTHMDTLVFSMAVGDIDELKIKDKKIQKKINRYNGYDFSIVLEDSLGNTAKVASKNVISFPKKIRSRFTKFKFLDKQMMGKDTEVQLKGCYVPFSKFQFQQDSLDLEKMKSIHFVFDKDTLGIIVLDDIGFYRKP